MKTIFRRGGTAPASGVSPRRALRLLTFGALGGAAALGGLWLAVLYVPLPASQVIPRVAAALQARLGPDYAVTIEDAELHRGRDGVELRLTDVAIAKTGGPVVARVPRTELGLEGLALLRGVVTVRTVHLSKPRLDLRLNAALEAASKETDLPPRLLAAVGDLDRLLGKDGAAGALEELRVSDATIVVAPHRRAPLELDGVDLRLSRGGDGAIALIASSARTDARWSAAVTVTPDAGDDGRVVDLGLENVDLAPFSASLAEKAGASPLKGRLSGHVNARIGPAGALLSGAGRIEARGVRAAVPGPPPASGAPDEVALDRVEINARWDAAQTALVIEPSEVAGRGGRMAFTGRIAAPVRGAAVPSWSATLEGRDVLLAGEQAGDAPLRLDRINVEAAFDPRAGTLDIVQAQFRGPTAKAAASGLIRFEGASPAIRLGLVSEPMAASALMRLWPFFIAPPTRSWVVENVSGGRVESLSISLDIGSGVLANLKPREPLPHGAMAIDVTFSNATLRGAPGLPWIESANGRAAVTARTALAIVDRGVVASPDGSRAIAIADARFGILDMALRYQPASLSFKFDGPLGGALALVASGSIGKNPLPPQLDIAKASGRIEGDIALALELGHENEVSPPPPHVKIAADLTDVTIAAVFAGRSLENAAFRLQAAGGRVDIVGKGEVGGTPAGVSIVETSATATTPARRRLSATLMADSDDLTRLGFDVPGVLRGPLPLRAEMALDEPGAPIEVAADLTGVAMDGVAPGFQKPAGRPGRLAFLVESGPERTRIKDFVLESGDRSVRGTLEFGPRGELLSANLPIYRPAPGDDARVEIDRLKSGVTKVLAQGASLDLKPLIDAGRGKSAPGARGAGPSKAGGQATNNLDVTAKLGTGLGYGGEALAGLDLTLRMRDGKVVDADGSGRIGGGAIKLATGDDGRLKLTGDDAGAFFRLADLYGRVDGGAFTLSASLAGGPGELSVRNFSVRNDTALESVRRTTGADGAAAAPKSASTRFDRLRVRFVKGDGKLDVREAVVYGPQLGATLEGVLNYAEDQVDLVGTFVPVYALNNLLSKVPIVGALLGGGEHGGLLGVTFQVRGPTAAPVVTINPMSAVAPGFLRKIFAFRQAGAEGGAPAAPTP